MSSGRNRLRKRGKMQQVEESQIPQGKQRTLGSSNRSQCPPKGYFEVRARQRLSQAAVERFLNKREKERERERERERQTLYTILKYTRGNDTRDTHTHCAFFNPLFLIIHV